MQLVCKRVSVLRGFAAAIVEILRRKIEEEGLPLAGKRQEGQRFGKSWIVQQDSQRLFFPSRQQGLLLTNANTRGWTVGNVCDEARLPSEDAERIRGEG